MTVPIRPSSGAAGDRAERVEVALEAVHGGPAGRLERRAQAALGDARLGDHGAQAGGEDGAQDRVVRQLVDHVGRRQMGARDRDDFVEQTGRSDAREAQAREAFDDQCQGGDRADEEWPDGPTGGLYDRKQYGPFRRQGGEIAPVGVNYGVRLGALPPLPPPAPGGV
jgi:hypothetical protein